MDEITSLFTEITTDNNTISIQCAAIIGDTWQISGRTRNSQYPGNGWNDAQDWTFNQTSDTMTTSGKDGQIYPLS